MHTSLTDPLVKETILKSFMTEKSTLCAVICTSAFDMGVDCKCVRKVISFGAPNDLEDCIQITGRGGRDGLPSEATLILSPDLIKHCSDEMKSYCKLTDECRRDYLFSDYDNYCKTSINQEMCCDICDL